MLGVSVYLLEPPPQVTEQPPHSPHRAQVHAQGEEQALPSLPTPSHSPWPVGSLLLPCLPSPQEALHAPQADHWQGEGGREQDTVTPPCHGPCQGSTVFRSPGREEGRERGKEGGEGGKEEGKRGKGMGR